MITIEYTRSSRCCWVDGRTSVRILGVTARPAATPTPDLADLLARIEATDLRGRGGAGFPLATKLTSVAAQPAGPIVVANGEEGEPGSVKDRHLMRTRPHLILDGLARAAAIVGAERGFVYVSDPTPPARSERRWTNAPNRSTSRSSRWTAPTSPARRPRSSGSSTAARRCRSRSRRGRSSAASAALRR